MEIVATMKGLGRRKVREHHHGRASGRARAWRWPGSLVVLEVLPHQRQVPGCRQPKVDWHRKKLGSWTCQTIASRSRLEVPCSCGLFGYRGCMERCIRCDLGVGGGIGRGGAVKEGGGLKTQCYYLHERDDRIFFKFLFRFLFRTAVCIASCSLVL